MNSVYGSVYQGPGLTDVYLLVYEGHAPPDPFGHVLIITHTSARGDGSRFAGRIDRSRFGGGEA